VDEAASENCFARLLNRFTSPNRKSFSQPVTFVLVARCTHGTARQSAFADFPAV
jgi:hypothetical protein